jgi:rhodanese-related sulfurtransferase
MCVAPVVGMAINRITVGEVRERLARGEPLALVDARSAEAWEKADLQPSGSVRVPPDDVAGYVDRVPKDRAVVTFCT